MAMVPTFKNDVSIDDLIDAIDYTHYYITESVFPEYNVIVIEPNHFREYQVYKEKLRPRKIIKRPFRKARNNLINKNYGTFRIYKRIR